MWAGVRARVCEREREHVCVRVRMCVCVCVCVRVAIATAAATDVLLTSWTTISSLWNAESLAAILNLTMQQNKFNNISN